MSRKRAVTESTLTGAKQVTEYPETVDASKGEVSSLIDRVINLLNDLPRAKRYGTEGERIAEAKAILEKVRERI